jgi:hypothetical protein
VAAHPSTCSEPAPGAKGRDPRLCGTDLTTTTPESAPASLVNLSRLYRTDAGGASYEFVGDLITLVATSARRATLRSGKDLLDSGRHLAEALEPVADAMSDPDGPAFRALVGAAGRTRPRPLPSGWGKGSASLISTALRIRDPLLGPTDRMRWKSVTVGERPTGGTPAAAEMVGRLPSSLWPTWTARLLSPGAETAALFGAVASAALLIPGSRLHLNDLCSLVIAENRHATPSNVSRLLRDITDAPTGTAVLSVLVQLAGVVATSAPPIDYARRREIASRCQLLNERTWEGYCAADGTALGSARKLGFARLWIWETLTGGTWRQAPARLLLPGRTSAWRTTTSFAV